MKIKLNEKFKVGYFCTKPLIEMGCFLVEAILGAHFLKIIIVYIHFLFYLYKCPLLFFLKKKKSFYLTMVNRLYIMINKLAIIKNKFYAIVNNFYTKGNKLFTKKR